MPLTNSSGTNTGVPVKHPGFLTKIRADFSLLTEWKKNGVPTETFIVLILFNVKDVLRRVPAKTKDLGDFVVSYPNITHFKKNFKKNYKKIPLKYDLRGIYD